MRLLLVDNDPDFRWLVQAAAPAWLEVAACPSTREAIGLLDSPEGEAIHLALVDLSMDAFLEPLDELEGLGFVRWMRSRGKGIPTILVSAHPELAVGGCSDDTAVVGLLRKPVDFDNLFRFCGTFRDLFLEREAQGG